MYVNEMQRTINGFGQPGRTTNQIIPYAHWMPFHPGAIARQPGFGAVPAVDALPVDARQWVYDQLNPINDQIAALQARQLKLTNAMTVISGVAAVGIISSLFLALRRR